MLLTCLPPLLLWATLRDAEDASSALAEALALARRGRYSQADRLYRKILKKFPDSDAADVARRRLEKNALLRVVDLEVNGDPDRRIDVFVLGDGYLRDGKHQRLFDRAAKQLLGAFLQAPVFQRYRRFFNFHAMNVASAEDGIDRRGRDADTALGAYESGAAQGQVAVRPDRVFEYLAMDPRSEGLAIVIVRLGSLGTGGGGIAVVGGAPSNTVIHEWGHAFAGLLDEYTSDVGYTGPTPRGVNVSDTDDPTKVPWTHFLEAKVKGVGVFPGAAGRSQGAWRPTASGCAMASGPSYCAVCREAVVRSIYERVSPLDEVRPDPDQVLVVEDGRPVTVEVVPMSVSGPPALEVLFGIEETQEPFDAGSRPAEAEEAAEAGADFLSGLLGGDEVGGGRRFGRGPRAGKTADPPPSGEKLQPKRGKTRDGRPLWRVVLDRRRLVPGRYILHVRVRDPTDWVLKEEWKGLLSEARTWRVLVR